MTLDLTGYIEDHGEIEDEYRSLAVKAHKELQELGIVPPPQPIDHDGSPICPVIPPGIGDMHFSELTILLAEFAAYSGFVKYQLADICIDAMIATRSLRDVKAHLRARMKGGTPADKADRMTLDKRYREADLKEFKANAKKELAKAVDEGTDRAFFSVSRAITSRGHERGQSDRESNVAGNVPQRKVDPLTRLRRKRKRGGR